MEGLGGAGTCGAAGRPLGGLLRAWAGGEPAASPLGTPRPPRLQPLGSHSRPELRFSRGSDSSFHFTTFHTSDSGVCVNRPKMSQVPRITPSSQAPNEGHRTHTGDWKVDLLCFVLSFYRRGAQGPRGSMADAKRSPERCSGFSLNKGTPSPLLSPPQAAHHGLVSRTPTATAWASLRARKREGCRAWCPRGPLPSPVLPGTPGGLWLICGVTLHSPGRRGWPAGLHLGGCPQGSPNPPGMQCGLRAFPGESYRPSGE